MLTEWQCPACLEVYDVEEGQPTPAVCPDCAGEKKTAAPPRPRKSPALKAALPRRDFSDVDRAAGFSQGVAYLTAWLGIVLTLAGLCGSLLFWSQSGWIAAASSLPLIGYGILISLNAVFGYALAGAIRVIVDMHRST